MPEPRQFVNEVSARYAALEYVANETWWTANVSSSDAADDAHAAANVALRTFFSDAETFAEIRDALAETRAVGESGRAVDANLVRELEILLQRFLPNQISEESRLRQVELETRIGSTYNRFRSTLDGVRVSDNEIVGLLRESTDATKRRKAWEASKQIGEAVANDVRALVRLRNEAARGLGFRDYFEMGLSTSDLDEDRLFATLAELETMTDGVWRERKGELDAQLAARFGVPVDDLRPWHYEDPFFQELPLAGSSVLETHFGQLDPTAVTLETFDALGLDARSVVDRSDLYARDAKSQHAFCVHLDRSGDVRVLCNVEPNRHWMGTMLHEFGHAVYDEAVDPTLPWLVREPAHALTTEAIALMFGRLTNDAAWLRRYAGVPSPVIDEQAKTIAAAKATALLVSLRWMLVMTTFERALYADPDGDNNTRWWDLVERFQCVPRPEGRDKPDWAAKVHIALAPVYYQNYIYGEMLASQLEQHLASGIDATDPRANGAYLVERFFRPGATLRWDHLVESATAEPLTPRHLVSQIGSTP